MGNVPRWTMTELMALRYGDEGRRYDAAPQRGGNTWNDNPAASDYEMTSYTHRTADPHLYHAASQRCSKHNHRKHLFQRKRLD